MAEQSLPNLRPLAVAIVREALDARPSGDSGRVAAMIRRSTTGWDRRERLRLTAVLAWLAGDLASRVPVDERDATLHLVESL